MDTHIASTNLTRLLTRLSTKLLSSTPPPTTLERTKIASNLEHARQLLLTLEKSAGTLRTHARAPLLSKLGEQKALIRRLNERLQLLLHDDASSDSGDDSDNDLDAGGDDITDPHPTHPVTATDATTTEGLRNRFDPAPTHTEQRASLFNLADEKEVSPETALDVHRAEQEAITTDMLALAQQLKTNSMRFGEELEKEKGILALAAEGLDRNVTGIEGAGRNMDRLRRDESVGWLWGILYPAIIVALMFFVLLVLFGAPKLRWW